MEANQSITMHDRRRRLCAAHASSLALRPKLLLAINIGCPRPCLPIPSFEAPRKHAEPSAVEADPGGLEHCRTWKFSGPKHLEPLCSSPSRDPLHVPLSWSLLRLWSIVGRRFLFANHPVPVPALARAASLVGDDQHAEETYKVRQRCLLLRLDFQAIYHPHAKVRTIIVCRCSMQA